MKQSQSDTLARVQFDVYEGLLFIGYTQLAAARALTLLGITPNMAKAIAAVHQEGLNMNDITYRDEGTVILFSFLTEAAQSFSNDHINWESWQQLGPHSFAADRRPARDLIDILRAEGFTVMEVR